MLVRVAPGQVRFVMPGLAADPRGVATGRDLVFRFTTLDRMVTFLRLLTAEQDLDDLARTSRIVFARPGHGSREVLIFFEQAGSHAMEAAARAVRAVQGRGYTGGGRHFVSIRDTASPLGYDLASLPTLQGDVILHGHEGVTTCRLENELSLLQLILRLELRREHRGPESLVNRQLPPVTYLVARQGLGETMVAYFHRSGIDAHAASIEGGGSAAGPADRYYLFRLEHPPARLARLLQTTPGLQLYVPATEGVAVAFGYRHPLHLESCRSLLQGDRLILLSAPPAPPRFIQPAPHLLSVQDLVRLDVPAITPVDAGPHDRARAPDLQVELQLARGKPRSAATVAALLPRSQARWLQRLCFALPESSLARYQAAFIDDQILVVAPESLEWFPLGQLMGLAARGVLVPVGCALRPAVSEQLLEEHFRTGDGSMVVFAQPGKPPVRVSAEMLKPLERRILADWTDTDATALARPSRPGTPPGERPAAAAAAAAETDTAPEINYRSGRFMWLWGSR